MPRLFIIGNGVDLANGAPADFHNDFRPIAKRNERYPVFSGYDDTSLSTSEV
jgi:hypothetical protein